MTDDRLYESLRHIGDGLHEIAKAIRENTEKQEMAIRHISTMPVLPPHRRNKKDPLDPMEETTFERHCTKEQIDGKEESNP
jgi:hypothetical protein